jgi:hypothetical protein
VKLSIDGKVIAKARATSKESKKNLNAPILLYKKMDKNNIYLHKTTTFSLVN